MSLVTISPAVESVFPHVFSLCSCLGLCTLWIIGSMSSAIPFVVKKCSKNDQCDKDLKVRKLHQIDIKKPTMLPIIIEASAQPDKLEALVVAIVAVESDMSFAVVD